MIWLLLFLLVYALGWTINSGAFKAGKCEDHWFLMGALWPIDLWYWWTD